MRSAWSITCSEIWCAPASTMTIASHVPATIRSSADSLICVSVGLSISCPSSMPTRTQATGPPCGMPLICSAHEAPVTARVAGSCSWSLLSTVATIWTSLRKSLGKSGRIGRSIIRLVIVAASLGLPSRRGNDPGMRPTA